jgi:lauroyl/myristoyl acyltransferase
MTPELLLFAKKYIRLLRAMSIWVALTPRDWRPRLILAAARWFSPYQVYADKVKRSIRLALPQHDATHIWHHWLDSHLRFVLDFLNYKSWDATWLRRCVVVANPRLLSELGKSGGLLLTYHTHHQNTLCCALGLSGIKVSAIATMPEDSALFPYIGAWAQRVNSDSAVHFLGGGYVFTKNLRALLKSTRQLLSDREVVVCLCDFHQPKSSLNVQGGLFDRSVSPPNGAIEIALKHGAPIYAAMFAPVGGVLTLQLTQLDVSGGLGTVVAGYFSFLESNIRSNPACWQGWEWFEDLPLTEQANS